MTTDGRNKHRLPRAGDTHQHDRGSMPSVVRGKLLSVADRRLLHAAGVEGEARATPVTGGFANDLLRVCTTNRTVALRRWIRDPAVADIEPVALAEAAADGIPVPEVLAADPEGAVLSWVDGPRADQVLDGADDATARQVGQLLGELAVLVADRDRGAAGTVRFVEGNVEVTPWPFTGPETLEYLVERAGDAPAGWAELALRHTDELTALDEGTARVHADLNPKNVLLAPAPDGWRVAALLDWEFTFAGPAEVDIGNLLRFEARDHSVEPFGIGVREGLGGLDDARTQVARALDLLALCGFLTPVGPRHAVRQAVHRLAVHQVATGKI